MTQRNRITRMRRGWLLAALAVGGVATAGLARAEETTTPWWERPTLRIATEDGQTSLRFRLSAQFRWEGLNKDPGPGKDGEWSDAVFFRRIRPVLEGSVLTQDLTWRLHVNLVPGQLELDDLWVSYAAHPEFRLLFGQNKIPFTRYRMDSFTDLPLVDWSYETKYFGAERQIGLTLHNGMDRPPEFEYEFGIYTGVNARASNGTALPRVFAETPPNPSSLTDPALPSSFHPELAAHFAWNYGGINVRNPSDLEGGPFRFSIGLSATWDARPTERQDMALRVAPEFMIKVAGFHLLGVFYVACWDEVTGDNPINLGLLGGVVQASYTFLERFEVAVRYANVSILQALRDDARTYADRRIAAEPDPDAQAALVEQYKNVGRLTAEHEATLGFTVYLLGTTLKLQIDGGLQLHERTDANRYDALVRSQLQLAF